MPEKKIYTVAIETWCLNGGMQKIFVFSEKNSILEIANVVFEIFHKAISNYQHKETYPRVEVVHATKFEIHTLDEKRWIIKLSYDGDAGGLRHCNAYAELATIIK